MENLIQKFENQINAIEKIKGAMFTAIKVPMQPVGQSVLMEGQNEKFASPSDTFGIYKSTGGNCLGITKGVFEPVNLPLLLDVIYKSVEDCGVMGLDLNNIKFNEYLGGRKVSIDIPFKDFDLNEGPKKVGDITKTKLQFRTGFDGLTKMSLGFYTYRLWCSNGAGNWNKDIAIKYRNTEKNVKKMYLFCSEITKATNSIESHFEQVKALHKKRMSKQQLDGYLSTLLGFDINAEDLHVKRQNLLSDLLECIDVEMTNTGSTEFSLLQGVTRFTTHKQAEGNVDAILYGTAAEYNEKIHRLLLVE